MATFSSPHVERLDTLEKRADAIAVRMAVFVDEQKYALEDEIDSYDDVAEHWAAYCDRTNEDGSVDKHVPVGTIRLIPLPDGVAKLGRLAVLSSARGLYIGQLLVKSFIEYVKEKNFNSIVLHSQYPRRGFYAKLGFVIEEGDEIFDEDGTPHIRMWMRKL